MTKQDNIQTKEYDREAIKRLVNGLVCEIGEKERLQSVEDVKPNEQSNKSEKAYCKSLEITTNNEIFKQKLVESNKQLDRSEEIYLKNLEIATNGEIFKHETENFKQEIITAVEKKVNTKKNLDLRSELDRLNMKVNFLLVYVFLFSFSLIIYLLTSKQHKIKFINKKI